MSAEQPVPSETPLQYWQRCGRHDEIRRTMYYVVTAYDDQGRRVEVQWRQKGRFLRLRSILSHFWASWPVVTYIRLLRRLERRRNDSS